MLIKTKGIVFRTIKYSETSVIADIYTEEKGMRKYIISGVRSKKAKVSASLLQVMSIVDLVAYEREGRDLHRVKELRPAYVYQSIPFDVLKGAAGLFMAEVARKTIRGSEENRPLFRFLFQTFTFLDQTEASIANLPLLYLLEFSAFLGFIPSGEYSSRQPFFDLREGVFVAQIPATHGNFLDESLSKLLARLLESSGESCHLVKVSHSERRELLRDLLDYYRLHIDNLPEIYSHTILQEVMEG